MATLQEWFNLYNAIAGNTGGIRANVAGITDSLNAIRVEIEKGAAAFSLVNPPLSDPVKALFLGGFPGLQGKSAQEIADTLEVLGVNKLRLADLLTLLIHTVSQSLRDPDQPVPKAMSALEKAMTELTKEASPSLLEDWREWFTLEKEKRATGEFVGGGAGLVITPKLREKFYKALGIGPDSKIVKGFANGREVVEALEAPFKTIVELAIARFRKTIEAGGKADPRTVNKTAIDALVNAFELGQGAHLLGLAGELIWPLKYLGIPQAAAAVADYSGFKEVSGTIARALIGAAITRPMRWAGNMSFSPEIPRPQDLLEFVWKRELDLDDYGELLKMHGFNAEDVDTFTRAVWREPSLRDLGVMIDDVTVDEAFLSERVRRAGYDDPDAEKLTGALIQRIIKSSRAILISAGRSSVAQGTMTLEEFQQILEGQELSPRVVALEAQAAAINRHREYVNDAIAVYRTQYQNDVIERSDFALALETLGVDPDQQNLILAAADARKFPQIAREEERQAKEAIREIQRELVPRYRRLFELGLVTADTYRDILIQAGISPGVAATAVSLDATRVRFMAAQSGNIALERENARLIAETTEALKIQFRKGLVDLAMLERSLLDMGIPESRARTIVEQERARAYQPPPREIPRPEEVKERLLSDLAFQTALNDFRRGRTDALELFDELVRIGLDEDEAYARVNLEISRLPAPSPTA